MKENRSKETKIKEKNMIQRLMSVETTCAHCGSTVKIEAVGFLYEDLETNEIVTLEKCSTCGEGIVVSLENPEMCYKWDGNLNRFQGKF